MGPLTAVIGPRDAGPGERHEMLQQAQAVLDHFGLDDPVRIDVPPKGSSDGDEAHGALRAGVEAVVPALQSGSLFGGQSGMLLVDAQSLLKSEAEAIADLVSHLEGDDVVAVFVAAGAIPAPLGAVMKEKGETISVRKMRGRDAAGWLADASKSRGIKLDGDARAALLQRFGTDVAAMGQALDQLAAGDSTQITADEVQSRFHNRPDEPMWHYADALASGDTGQALRRLADFLAHGHPLQLLAFVENEIRRLALAGAAPNLTTYAEWVGGNADSFPVQKAWRRRSEVRGADVAKALEALSRADFMLKTTPEVTHRVMLERLTVALCRWLGRKAVAVGA